MRDVHPPFERKFLRKRNGLTYVEVYFMMMVMLILYDHTIARKTDGTVLSVKEEKTWIYIMAQATK